MESAASNPSRQGACGRGKRAPRPWKADAGTSPTLHRPCSLSVLIGTGLKSPIVSALLLVALGSCGAGNQGLGLHRARLQREARSLAYLWVDTPNGPKLYRTDPSEQPLKVKEHPNGTVTIVDDGKPCFICR
jgi:hypothetical protein